MYVFINSVDRTDKIIKNSIIISDEIQEKINSCSFYCSGFTPEYLQEIKVYDGFPILSSTANSITINKSYNTAIQNNIFRKGEIVFVAINESDEESGEILSITNDSDNVKLTFTVNFDNQPSDDELCGKKVFAGNINKITDKNIGTLSNIEYFIDCLDYQKLFDKSSINDSYTDRDARYIINDFCNTTINKNKLIDSFEFATNGDIQTEWVESGDGNNPTTSSAIYREGNYAGIFSWTNSGGTATFTKQNLSVNLIDFTGVASGQPSKGILGFWIKSSSFANITSIEVRIGSDSSNYVSQTITLSSTDWEFIDIKLKLASLTGTPDWSTTDYFVLIITETEDGSINIDGARILEEQFFRHSYVEETIEFDDFRIPRTKPNEVMQRLADNLSYYWFIDYERNIRFFSRETNNSPFNLTETSNNFSNLKIDYDTTRLANRIVVEGGTETSTSFYTEVREGDGIVREWLTKNKFKNLVVKIDKNTVTDTMEAGTDTTTINATGHGLTVGDYIVNRTRSNAVRKVLTTPSDDQFTVEAVASQTNGDTFSTFVAATVGVEGINEDTSYDYMSNFNEKSIRASSITDVLFAGEFIQFIYNEVFTILVQRSDAVSINNLQSILGFSDGIIDGQKIIDKTIQSRVEAIQTANAFLEKYSNLIITATFDTYQHGLVSGQLINIKDTLNGTRNIDQNFVIQKVRLREIAWGENIYSVTCSSFIFGFMELLAQLLKQNRKLDVAEDQIINNIISAEEKLVLSDALVINRNLTQLTDQLSLSDSLNVSVITPPFQYGPGGSPQGRYNLSSYS